MDITELANDEFESALWSIDDSSGHVRSEGLHVSTIIQEMEEEAGRSKKRAGISQGDLNAYRGIGFLWERILAHALRVMYQDSDSRIMRVNELCVDNIYLSPDASFVNPQEYKVEEYKATFTSSRKPIESKTHWIAQMMAYCYAMKCTKAHLRVLYVCGNWRPPTPQVKQYEFSWTPLELTEHWQSLVGFAKMKGWL